MNLPSLCLAKVGIPCWSCTSLCGSADRRLSCSANGMTLGRRINFDPAKLKVVSTLDRIPIQPARITSLG